MPYQTIRPLLYRQNRQLYKQIARALLLPLAIGLPHFSLLSLACSSGDDSAAKQGEPAAGEPYAAEQGEVAGGGEASEIPAICTPSQAPETAQRIRYADPCSADPADLYSEKTECYFPQERPIDIRIEGTLPAYDRRVGAFFFPVAEEDSQLALSYSLPKQGSLYISSGSNGSGAAEELAAEEPVTEETRLNVGELDLQEQASCRVLRASYSDGTEERLALYLTRLPIAQVTVREPILHGHWNVDNIRRPGSFRLNDPDFRRHYRTGRESLSCAAFEGHGKASALSGLSSIKYSWRMELREGEASEACSSEEERDIPLLGLYDDGDWIVRSQKETAGHLRDQVATDIAIDLMRFGHSHKEPDMVGGSRGHFVELFINDRYHGTYTLKEKINPKLLQLKEDAFLARVRRDLLTQAGFPSSSISLIDNASDQDFTNQIDKMFEMDNVVDLHILINLFAAHDNFEANGYIGCYSPGLPCFFVLWDLDASWATWLAYKLNIMTIEDSGYCDHCFTKILLQRLASTNAASFRSLLKARWEDLRRGPLTHELLKERFENYASMWKLGGADQRNLSRWFDPDAEMPRNFLKPEALDAFVVEVSDWIEKRLELLDAYYAAIDQRAGMTL